MKRYFLLWTFLSGLLFSYSQDGRIDSSFAGKGWTNLYFFNETSNSTYEYGIRTMVQSDSKYLVVIDLNGPMLARYYANGMLDKSFGVNGFTANVYGFNTVEAALQNDGKAVLAGFIFNGADYDLSLLRYNPDGSLDNTFGTDGLTAGIDFFGTSEYPSSVAIQNNGKIVVAGYAYNPGTGGNDMILARFNADGTLDSGFGTNGRVTTDIPDVLGSSYEEAHAVVIQGDKVLVAGIRQSPATYFYQYVTLVRYNSDGSLDAGDGGSDPGFGTGGISITGFGEVSANARAMAVQTDGKIVVAGYLDAYDYEINGPTSDFLLIRFTSAGNLDADFSGDGIDTADFGSTDAKAYNVVIQSDGKIVISGTIANAITGADFCVARYQPDGTLDSGFQTDGHATTDLGSSNEYPNTMTLQSDDKIILTGFADFSATGGNLDFAIVRYLPAGSLDNNFNGTGILLGYYAPGTSSQINAMATQSDGKVVVVGTSYNPATSAVEIAVALYNPDGTLDLNFGSGGIASTNFGPNNTNIMGVAVQNNGKIIVGAEYDSNPGDADFALARFTATGVPDSSFDTDGRVITNFGGEDKLTSIAVQTDGKIVAAGNIGNGDFTVVRYTASGALDPSFGTGGKITTDFFGENDNALTVAIQNDGKIVVAGDAYNPANGSDFALARYTATGKLDNTFGDRGKTTTDILGSNDNIYGLALQGDGKVVVAGTSFNFTAGNSDFALARYTAAGTPDLSFDSDGKVTTDLGAYDYIYYVTLQTDNKIIAGGFVNNLSTTTPTITRYTVGGALDTTFDNDGKLVSNLPNSFYTAVAWNNERVYAAGYIYDPYPNSGLLEAYKAASSPVVGPPVVSINDATIKEDVASTTVLATLTVSLDKPSTSAITINYATQDVTAAGKGKTPDYKSLRSSLTIPAGSTTGTINVTINNDNLPEEEETFNVNISLSRRMADLATIGDTTGVIVIQASDLGLTGVNAAQAKTRGPEETLTGKLLVKAVPNPSSGQFTLQLQSINNTPVTISITDASGKVIETKTGLFVGSIQLGAHYRPGVYYAQVVQGTEKVNIKLVKQ